MNQAGKIAALVSANLGAVLSDSGHLLYSSADTVQPGPAYLLGHNPGGSPEGREDESIAKSLENLSSKKSNEYVDDSWKGRAPGTSPLQVRVCWLLERLGLDVRNVCASNLIFSRSVDAANSNFSELADLCWPIHEALLKIVRPKLILSFGNSGDSPYSFVRARLNGRRETSYPSGHGNWQCKSCVTNEGVVIVGLPHLSRYAVNHHKSVPEWISKLCPLTSS